MFLPDLTRLEPLLSLPNSLPLERFYDGQRKLQRPARPIRLRIAMRTDRPPHHHSPGIEIHMVPGERTGLLRPHTGQQTQRDERMEP